ncbi:MAG: cobalt ECF transporter T component CbiQ [Chloroflexi bacterium]|nr:cobalt ECF transporter T component CbiQ [Chloroflexota bacterium]
MHVHFLDPYQDLRSPVHALDARVKLVLALVFILVVSLTPNGAWASLLLLFAVAVSAVLLAGLNVGYVLRRAGLALPFALAALPLVFTAPGARIELGATGISLSQIGIERLLSIFFKSYVSMQMAIVLASATSFPDLLQAMRAIRLPKLLVAIFGLMWRYLFVLVDEAMRLLRARDSRSGALDAARNVGGSISWRARSAGGMAGNLFMRSFERGDRIYDAMAARGYDGEVRSMRHPALSAQSLRVLVAGLVLLSVLFALPRLFA